MMHSDALGSVQCAGTPQATRPAALERRLERFAERFRAPVRALAESHPSLADLAWSFPALLFALAVPRRLFRPETVIARVIGGARLSEVGALAEVPSWFRKLPPEAFTAPLPRLPDGDAFRRQIANHLPRSTRLAPRWLQAVADAAVWGDEQIAVWTARQIIAEGGLRRAGRLRLLCLWAWHSLRPEAQGHLFIDRPWNDAIGFGLAERAAKVWHTKAALHLSLGDEPVADMWLQPSTMGGYEFVPLRTAADITTEAVAMRNCLMIYGGDVARNRARLWSMRKDGERIATLQVVARQSRDPLPTIVQMERAQNRSCSPVEWWIARQWLHTHDLSRMNIETMERGRAPLTRARWVSLWRPYWLAKRRIPDWLPLAPSRVALDALLSSLPGR